MLGMLNDFILVKADKVEEKTAGGLILTAGSADKPHRGTVVSVGPGRYNHVRGEVVPNGLSVGDVVVFPVAALGNTLEHDGETYHVMTSEQIFGIIK